MSVALASSLPAPATETPLERLDELLRREAFGPAAALAQTLVQAQPDDAVAWNRLGVALRGAGRPRQALPCLWRSVALAPNVAGSWSNLGNALKDAKCLRQSIEAHRRALALAPKRAVFWHNLGAALIQDRQYGPAIAVYDRALALEPERHDVRWDRGLARLQLGDYRQGWADYDARIETGQIPPRKLPGIAWDGSPYPGKRLLILSEQGFGDALWVARYLRQAKALGGELILEARRELIPLLAAQGIADRIVAKGDKLPAADLHLQQCSLPRLFQPAADGVEGGAYLTADPARVAKLAPLFAKAGRALKVGIVWSGSLSFKANGDRAQPLSRFVESFVLPGVQLYSLQKGPRADDLAHAGAGIVDLAPHLADFADTAAALEHLDLVIMTDSAVAHLAGALGRPVWVLLNHAPHFLWSPACDAAPWYRSVRLLRPAAWEDWGSVFDQAAAALLQATIGRGQIMTVEGHRAPAADRAIL